MATITFEDVTKTYPDGTEAVCDLDLQIGDGEFMVFVGPSGCGKSTALKMVAGLEGITDGAITIGDQVVNELPPKDRDIAMVFQDYALYPHMTVYDNMAFSLKVRKFDKADIRRRVHDAAVILGIEDLLDRRPKALSGGQRQRVAMGRAIVREPEVFLLDEPLSNLDAKLRVQMRTEIRRIQTNLDVTTIFVTHDQTEAMTMGDRVAVLKKGRLQQVDTPQVLYEQPVNLFVAGFIGSPAMNMAEARIDRQDGRLGVRLGSTWLELDPSMLARRPDLERYEGRPLVLGIRPETIQHERFAGLDPVGRRLRAKVDLVESLGSEILLHFDVDAPPVLTEDTRELARDREETDKLEGLVEERVSTFVAKTDPRAQARLGDTVDLVIDTARLHLFDPADGSRIE